MDQKICLIRDLIFKSELDGEICHLKHSVFDPSENHKAVIFLQQHFSRLGYENIEFTIQIPICKECIESLYDSNWILLYCVSCNSSQWIIKELSKRNYDKNVNFLFNCPNCFDKK